MQLFTEKKECCACESCLNACPKQAISIYEDENGFRYPQIDASRCIECGLCERVCAFQNIKEVNTPQAVYVASSLDCSQLEKSASGGIFAAIASRFIEEGGAVCGSHLHVKQGRVQVEHIIVERKEDIEKLQGSKYVQSSINDSYRQIRRLLINGRRVLFSGTPCQCAGLKAFLRKEYENLYLVDIICHGVPSLSFFNSYLDYKFACKADISNFAFRDKSMGWGLYGRVDFINGQSRLIPAGLSSYYSLFLDSQIYRENCYECKYASDNRPGDLTLGDYWGIEKEHPELITSGKYKHDKGVSAVIINTEQGRKLFETVSEKIVCDPSTYEGVVKRNKQLVAPSKKGKYYNEIFSLYRKCGYAAVDKFFRKYYIKQILIHSIYARLPFLAREILRKILK